jgi:GGDEF domain-containing protein
MLVLCFSLPTNLARDASAEVLGRYWRHTVFKAVAAREIAELCYDVPGEEAFVGGLLQNLGMLLLVQDLGNSYEKFLLSVWNGGGILSVEEATVLGFDHRLLTASLLSHWKLPEHLVEAVGLPHDVKILSPAESVPQSMAQVLHLAELVATFLVEPRPRTLDELTQVGHEYRGMTMSQLEALMSTLEGKVPQLAEVLSLELPGGTSYSSVLLDAYRQLSDELEGAPPPELDRKANPWFNDLTRNPLLRPHPHVHVPQNADGEEPTPGVTGVSLEAPNALSSATGRRVDAISCLDATCTETRISVHDASASRTRTVPWSTREGLVARVSVAVGHCRQRRSSLCLLLVDLDDVETVAFYCGVDQMPQTTRRLGIALTDLAESECCLLQIGDARYAMILENCDRRAAVAVARRIVEGVRIWKYPTFPAFPAGLSVSIGVAVLSLPPRNFPPEELLTAAERCLSGVQLSGGDGVKSIDIY